MILPAMGDFRLNTDADTARFGAAVGAELRKGEAVCLSGPLGAGKSVLARGLIRALAPGEGDVPSPTFTLVQFYQGRRFPIAHFDLYRLTDAREAYEIGLDEALERRGGGDRMARAAGPSSAAGPARHRPDRRRRSAPCAADAAWRLGGARA